MVVDEVEFARTLERVRDVQRLPDPAVHRGILRVAGGANAVEGGGRHRIECREQRHVDTARDQPVREQTGDLFPGPVVTRRRTPSHRAQEGDLHRGPGAAGYFFLTATCLAVTAACFLRLLSSVLLCF